MYIYTELFYMELVDKRDGSVKIWGYPTPRTRWLLSLKKVDNSLEPYPIFQDYDLLMVRIPMQYIRDHYTILSFL